MPDRHHLTLHNIKTCNSAQQQVELQPTAEHRLKYLVFTGALISNVEPVGHRE